MISVRKKEYVGIMISRVILSIMLICSVYAFVDKEPVVAKTLAAAGFIGIAFLLVVSFHRRRFNN
ncbi:hypothetical protein SAMN05421758_1125 [Salimicrobium salexigens]|uniref:Uncharacterized protein n=2 Tax=Salimicrobium salexigens TaxID=908941 RepID=A0ABY1KYS5_9BACI|nr:hypothetical protein SAMN05421758_1125 [Salimicrobium salexigens]